MHWNKRKRAVETILRGKTKQLLDCAIETLQETAVDRQCERRWIIVKVRTPTAAEQLEKTEQWFNLDESSKWRTPNVEISLKCLSHYQPNIDSFERCRSLTRGAKRLVLYRLSLWRRAQVLTLCRHPQAEASNWHSTLSQTDFRKRCKWFQNELGEYTEFWRRIE